MTNVTFKIEPASGIASEPHKIIFSSKGHAGYGPKGADIVCAALSALCCTLTYSMELEKEENKLLSLKTKLEEGNVELEVVPRNKYEKGTIQAFGTILNGYRLLADNYPDYVRLDESEFHI